MLTTTTTTSICVFQNGVTFLSSGNVMFRTMFAISFHIVRNSFVLSVGSVHFDCISLYTFLAYAPMHLNVSNVRCQSQLVLSSHCVLSRTLCQCHCYPTNAKLSHTHKFSSICKWTQFVDGTIPLCNTLIRNDKWTNVLMATKRQRTREKGRVGTSQPRRLAWQQAKKIERTNKSAILLCVACAVGLRQFSHCN